MTHRTTDLLNFAAAADERAIPQLQPWEFMYNATSGSWCVFKTGKEEYHLCQCAWNAKPYSHSVFSRMKLQHNPSSYLQLETLDGSDSVIILTCCGSAVSVFLSFFPPFFPIYYILFAFFDFSGKVTHAKQPIFDPWVTAILCLTFMSKLLC